MTTTTETKKQEKIKKINENKKLLRLMTGFGGSQMLTSETHTKLDGKRGNL